MQKNSRAERIWIRELSFFSIDHTIFDCGEITLCIEFLLPWPARSLYIRLECACLVNYTCVFHN
jgi:hypothetical protein